MSSWRFIAERLNGDGSSEILHDDLPVSDPEIDDVESDLNALNFTITPEVKNMIADDGKPLLTEWSTAIYAEKDGQIRGGGIHVHSDFQGPSWAVECTGFLGYAKDMPYTGTGQFFIHTDTLDIARFLWTHIQAQDGGDIGLQFDNRKSGVLVGSSLTADEYDPAGPPGGLTLESQAYKLAYYQDLDLLSNFDDLASDTPFNYHERHYWLDGEIKHRVDFPNPPLGVNARHDLRFAVGENIIISPDIPIEGDDYASETYLLGAGEGARMIRGHASYPRTRLRRVFVRSDPGVRRIGSANNLAMNDLMWRRNIDDISEIQVYDHPNAPEGSLAPGDYIFVQGEVDWFGEINSWYKVTAIKTNPPLTMQTLTLARADKVWSAGVASAADLSVIGGGG